MNAADRLRARFRGSRGWFLEDGEGRQVAGPFETQMEAEARARVLKAEADARAKRGPRPCIRCGRTFDSEGIHNRMCNPCRHAPDALGDPQRPYIGGR